MTDFEEKTRRLSETAAFREMPLEMLGEIAQVIEDRVIPAKTLLFKRGDPGDSFWVIQTGKVRVFRRDDKGTEITFSELGPGKSFGEMALLTGEPRSASVETLEESRLMVLSKEQFDRVLKSHPDLSLSFIKQLSGWLKRDEQALETEAKRMSEPPRMAWFDFVILIGISVLFAFVFNQSNPNGVPLFPKMPSREAIPAVSLSAAAEELKKGDTLFVDAITANFYDKKHIKGAINMPLALFDLVYMMSLAEENKSRKIIVYGGTISRLYDLEVANKLVLRGFKNTRVLEGRLSEWEKKGYPVEP